MNWIRKTRENIPERYTKCLIFVKPGMYPPEILLAIVIKYGKALYFKILDNSSSWKRIHANDYFVTHWMPLPSNPKDFLGQ